MWLSKWSSKWIVLISPLWIEIISISKSFNEFLWWHCDLSKRESNVSCEVDSKDYPWFEFAPTTDRLNDIQRITSLTPKKLNPSEHIVSLLRVSLWRRGLLRVLVRRPRNALNLCAKRTLFIKSAINPLMNLNFRKNACDSNKSAGPK